MPIKLSFSLREERIFEAFGFPQLCGLAVVSLAKSLGRTIHIRSNGQKLTAFCAAVGDHSDAGEQAEAYVPPSQINLQKIGKYKWTTSSETRVNSAWIEKTAAVFGAEFIIIKPSELLIASPIARAQDSAAPSALRRIRCPKGRAAAKNSYRRTSSKWLSMPWFAQMRRKPPKAQLAAGEERSGN